MVNEFLKHDLKCIQDDRWPDDDDDDDDDDDEYSPEILIKIIINNIISCLILSYWIFTFN